MDARWLRISTLLLILMTAWIATATGRQRGFDPRGAGGIYPDLADGARHQRPSVRAYPLNGDRIHLDGRLDDAVWQRVQTGRGFMQMDPERGIRASEETVFKVAYDEDAIYFGVACYESDPALTSSALSRRDNLTASDMISIYVDPYHDQTTSYNFRINPHGVVEDSYLYDDGNGRDTDWDAVWESEVSADDQGWYAEMRIPFSAFRYRASESMTWGLQVYRWMHGRGEDTGWANWGHDDAGFVSRFGTLTDLDGIRPPRQLEVVPYVVGRATDPSDPDTPERAEQWDGFQNLGADFEYGVTADLTLNATVQPDFGQVEADPAQLNLSPFETFYSEKRPFFIEGGRFFRHPHYNLFYSRRIGTGSENSRIRFAGKLQGKMAGGLSIAGLFAATDETATGQAHNLFKPGEDEAYYGVVRVGKEFADGAHSVNLMQTAVARPGDRSSADWFRAGREAYSSGLDFNLNFAERAYVLEGSLVATVVDPAAVTDDPTAEHDRSVGRGGVLAFAKRSGQWRYGGSGSWESDRLDPNDIGFLSSPDEISSRGWLRWHKFDEGGGGLISNGNNEISVRQAWLYAGRRVPRADDPDEILWGYGAGLPSLTQLQTNGWWRLRSYWSFWYGLWWTPDGLNRTATRGGPPIVEPEGTGFWAGVGSDWRKDFQTELNFQGIIEPVGTAWYDVNFWCRWVQSQRLNHSLSLGFDTKVDVDQWVGNYAANDDAGDTDYDAGIGGTHYVFGELDRQVYDLTLRSNVLFTRDQSLELYFQPFLAVGSYSRPRELKASASHDLEDYEAEGFDVSANDFSVAAVNLNLVYRWEYRPGSTFYLVWTHSRDAYDERGFHADPTSFDNGFGLDPVFASEAENTFLAKVTYWFSI